MDKNNDMDLDIDEETETQLKELEQLNAVLKSDTCSSTHSHSCLEFGLTENSTLDSVVSSHYPKSEEVAKVEMALALNKFTDEKLCKLEKMLLNRLRECRQKIKELYIETSPSFNKNCRQETFNYLACGKPYFKDSNCFPAPNNDDTILMMKSGMHDFSCISSAPGWTVKDKSDFIQLVMKMSQEIKIKELNSRISHIKRQAKSKILTKDAMDAEIDKVRREIEAVGRKNLKELALPIDQEYDWDTIANKLNHRHSVQEYRALWKVFLHPSINKNTWTKNEHTNLQKIAYSNNFQDWDDIARKLNTGRTGYQCFVYFRTNMHNNFVGQKWSIEEEEYLKRLIAFYREDDYIPWGKIAASMENRTKIQIYNKCMRLEEQRKGRFLPEEDAVILTCVDDFGSNYRKIKKYLPGRSTIQIRNRHQLLAKRRISTVWTAEEDKKLIQLMANHDTYSSVSKHFPGKDRVHLRARYLTLSKWMSRHPNTDLSLAPRRGARRLGHGQPSADLNNAVEKLKNRMQTEVAAKKSNTVTEESSEQEIEDAIIAALVTETAKEQQYKISDSNEDAIVCHDNTVISSTELNQTNLQKILILLKAKLNRATFKESDYYKKYQGLDDIKQDVSLVKVKSYSRKNTVETIQLSECPDIYGDTTLGALEYVLPPHYATITGCKMLMNYVSNSNNDFKKNIQTIIKKNGLLKSNMERLLERFNSLFLWPLLLSNEMPHAGIQQQSTDIAQSSPQSPQKKYVVLPQSPAITIPDLKKAARESVISNSDIDLPDNDEREKVTMDENIFNISYEDSEVYYKY